ncbi:hypothetical protein HPB50_024925 [Hyalomma asiaticum]|uniref:Uncharacterized protein n=1 Tax=Hyalomma asiaticum TaxID=266040 RepID=A0ACB7RQM4_HYAAI|nr:hypothetical protein HPB50_024925 [Hyalomma asiaticum]
MCQETFNATFKVAIQKHSPFYIPAKGSLDRQRGVDILLLETLASALGFRLHLVQPRDAKWGSFHNGSWNGMIGMIIRKEADIAAGGMSVLADRHAWVLFSSPYLLDRSTFIVRAPRKIAHPAILLRPFSWHLCTHRIHLDFFWASGCCSVQVLSMGYCGNLISYMTGAWPRARRRTRSINLHGEVLSNRFACGTIRDASEHVMLKSDNSSLSKLLLRSLESRERNFVQSDIEGLLECLRRNYAYIAAEITVDADIVDPERFLFARDNFRIESYALAFPSDFCCIEPVNRKIAELQAGGLVTFWLRQTMVGTRRRSYRDEPTLHPLVMPHFRGPFLLLGIGMAVSTLVALLEYTATRRICKYDT